MAEVDERPEDIGGLFAIERARLLDLLGTLSEADWQKPTPCPGWTVLGLCQHLVGDDFGLLSRQRDGHHGTRPPEGLSEPELIAWIDDLQVDWVRAARRMSPQLTADLLTWTGLQIVGLFATQDPTARTAHVSWAGPDPVPVWLDQVRELSEYWIHRQQLHQALGRPSDLRADLLRPILHGLRWAYPYRLSAVPAEPGDTVTIAIAGPVRVTWHVVAGEGRWHFRAAPGERLVGGLATTAETAWRLLTNNLAPAAHDRLELVGDEAVVEVLRNTRAIIGTPQ